MISIVQTRRLFLSLGLLLLFGMVGVGVAYGQDASSDEMTHVIVQLEDHVKANDRAKVHGLGGSVTHEYSLVPGMAIELPAAAVEALTRNPRVVRVETDVPVQAAAFEDEYAETWSLSNINAPSAHTDGTVGDGVSIGIIDSGVNYNHPDLADQYRGGYDFVETDTDPMDVYGHGTHVAGTACATQNGWGAVGVAPACDLYALRVLNDSGSGYTSDILDAVEWAATHDLDVINLSLGSSQDPGAYAEAVYQAAYDAGVLIVAAAGNSGNPPGNGTNTIWPANYDSVIAVAATDEQDKRARFSSTGENVELAAPGVAVHSTWNDSDSPHNPQPVCDPTYGCYKDGSGTSMASPHVAGAAALIIAAGIADADGNLRINDEVRAQLQTTAFDLGATGKDPRYGYGLIDAAAAVADIGPVDAPPMVTLIEPSDGSTATGTVSVVATASDDTALAELQLLIDGVMVASTTSSTTEFSWDTTSYTDGSHTITATAVDSADQVTSESVAVTVDNVNEAPTAVATAAPTTVALGDPVAFDGSASDDDRGISRYDWTFGDGATSSGATVNHTYQATGTFSAILTVTDTDGTQATDTVAITVTEPAPVASESQIDAITYSGYGGRLNDKHLTITLSVVSDQGDPVAGATIAATITNDSGDTWSISATTDETGAASYDLKNIPRGTYTTTIDSVTADGLTWDGVTPSNSYSTQ